MMEICRRHTGFEEDLIVTIQDPLAFAKWHLGLVEWGRVLRSGGVRMEGRRDLARALPTWNAGPQAHVQRREGRMREPRPGAVGTEPSQEEPGDVHAGDESVMNWGGAQDYNLTG